jgi:hypothetical protein
MNRVSWDSTAPRRIGSRRATSPQPRPEDGLVTADADLLRGAWDQLRSRPF